MANSATIAHFEPSPPFEIGSGLDDSVSESPHYVGFPVRTQTTINVRPDVRPGEGCGKPPVPGASARQAPRREVCKFLVEGADFIIR